jgi:hypothetical protein
MNFFRKRSLTLNSLLISEVIQILSQGNYPLFRYLISNTDWESIISKQPTVDIACELFTGCKGTNTVTMRRNDKIWITSEIRRELRVRDRLRKKFIQNKSIFNEIISSTSLDSSLKKSTL